MGTFASLGMRWLGFAWIVGIVASAHGQETPVAAAPPVPAAANDPTHLMESLAQGEGSWNSHQVAAEAVKSAPSLTRSAAALERSRQGAARAQAAVWPRLDLSARYTRLSRVPQGSLGSGGFDALQAVIDGQGPDQDPNARLFDQFVLDAFREFGKPFPQVLDQFALRAALSYPISDLFLSILPAVEAAQGLADAQALRIEADRETVALQAREAFYNYARARAATLVAQAGLDQAKAHQSDVAVMVAGGALAPVEEMRATAAVATAEVALARAQAGAGIARDALAIALRRELATDPAIGEDLTRLAPSLPAKALLIERAFGRRAEAKALSQTLSALDASIRSQRATAYPHLNLTAGFDLANPNPRVFPQDATFRPSWDVGAILSWSPNDMLVGDRQSAETRAERAQVAADLEALRDALKLEVSQAYETCVAANRALSAATPGIVAAEESYRVRREQFRAGSAVATDVLDAEGELRAARLQLINVAIDLRIAEARLARAVGGL